MRSNWKALAIVGMLACLGASEAAAQWGPGPYGRRAYGPYPHRGPYGPAFVPPVVVRPYPVVVNETRFLYTPPAVVTREIYHPPTVIERTVVQPPPVVERRVVQPPPVVETRVVQPPPVIERRVIQPPPVEQERVIQQSPVVETRVVQPVTPPLPTPY